MVYRTGLRHSHFPGWHRRRKVANLEKPTLLTTPVKTVLLDTGDLADQKSRAMVVRSRLSLPNTDQILLLLHPFLCTHPRSRPALGKEISRAFCR